MVPALIYNVSRHIKQAQASENTDNLSSENQVKLNVRHHLLLWFCFLGELKSQSMEIIRNYVINITGKKLQHS